MAVKRDAKFKTRHEKGLSFVKRKYERVPFLSKMVYKRIQQQYEELDLEAEPPCIKICLVLPQDSTLR